MNPFNFFIFFVLYCSLIWFSYRNTIVFIGLIVITLLCFIKYFFLQKEKLQNSKKLQESLREQREDFIYSLSHDLRIPILAQLRVLELIRTGTFGEFNSEQEEILAQTEQSSKCLLNLISLLINTYNFENESNQLIYQRFNLYELVVSCFEELRSEAEEKEITYEYLCKNKSIIIDADRENIKKLLLNLVSAANMYANYGEKISVKAGIRGDKLRLCIFCDGKNTYSIKTKINSKYTSIGESIRMHFCKKIIETHKGHILQSKINRGFEFELPVGVL